MCNYKQIQNAVEKLKQDYGNGMIYREDSVKNSIYHHLRNDFCGIKNKFIYPEYYLKSDKIRFDLIITSKKIDNSYEFDEKDFESIIEIKFLNLKFSGCMKKLREDINKLKGETKKNEIKNIDNSKKYFIYIFEIKDKLPTKDMLTKEGFSFNVNQKAIEFNKVIRAKFDNINTIGFFIKIKTQKKQFF